MKTRVNKKDLVHPLLWHDQTNPYPGLKKDFYEKTKPLMIQKLRKCLKKDMLQPILKGNKSKRYLNNFSKFQKHKETHCLENRVGRIMPEELRSSRFSANFDRFVYADLTSILFYMKNKKVKLFHLVKFF